jgi:hypothetical protein
MENKTVYKAENRKYITRDAHLDELKTKQSRKISKRKNKSYCNGVIFKVKDNNGVNGKNILRSC